jgi:L-malate glycosyltransferase
MVLHVGTYTGVKGHREALNIFIRSSVKNATLVLVGDKIHYLEKAYHSHYSYFGLKLRQLFKKKKVVFAELNREDTVAAFKEADLFLFPSNVECSPIVLFESMAAGVPFLASAAGNTAEIIQWSSAGWLMPGEKTKNGWVKIDVAGSIAKFEQVVANVRALRSAGEKGHAAWKAKFTWEIIAQRYLQLYHELTDQR